MISITISKDSISTIQSAYSNKQSITHLSFRWK